MSSLFRTINEFMSPDNWRDAQRYLEQHPELLDLETDRLMEGLAMAQADDKARERIEKHRKLLARCREVGTGAAFDEVINPPDSPKILLMRLMQALLTGDRESLRALITEHPEVLDRVQAKLPPGFSTELLKDLMDAAVAQDAQAAQALLSEHPDPIMNAVSRVMPEGIPPEVQRRLLESTDQEELRRIIAEYPQLERVTGRIAPPPGQGGLPQEAVIVPQGFELDMRRISLLEEAVADDPTAVLSTIEAYQRVLDRIGPGQHPDFRALVLSNLAHAYARLTVDASKADLKRAIEYYEQALEYWNADEHPYNYAQVHKGLGVVYLSQPSNNPAIDVPLAIASFEKALRFISDATPEMQLQYAEIQNNLGVAYADLPARVGNANLEKAINCYQEALRFRTPDVPALYAATQNNLGSAFAKLRTGDRLHNVERAIACYSEALRYSSPDTDRLGYAMINANLGSLYGDRLIGNPKDNLHKAIECFDNALRYQNVRTSAVAYANTQHSLGNAYRELAELEPGNNLARAITYYNEALRVFTPQEWPDYYAMVQNDLGNAYFDLPGDRQANLREAIARYEDSLRWRDSQAWPIERAMTLKNIGRAYASLEDGDLQANRARAVESYKSALKLLSPEAEPREWRQVNRALGDLQLSRQNWPAAWTAYSAAIAAGERSYQAGLSTESKAAEMSTNAALFRNAAFVATQLGRVEDALKILESGKTRLLAEALRLRVARPTGVPDEIWERYEEASKRVRALTMAPRESPNGQQDPIQGLMVLTTREEEATLANHALTDAVGRVREYDPLFLVDADHSAISNLLSDGRTAIISFCVTEAGTVAFVLHCNFPQLVEVVEVPGLRRRDLLDLLIVTDEVGEPVGGWLWDYFEYRRETAESRRDKRLRAWMDTMTRTLATLGKRLITPALAALPSGVERLVFLPTGTLFLLPLHAAPVGSDGALVCERYQVSYAPSMEVLTNCHSGSRLAHERKMYMVINPTDDPGLVFTGTEGAAIAQLFDEPTIRRGKSGTKRDVSRSAPGHSYVHFSCHGSYAWNDPPASGLILSDSTLTLSDLQQGMIDLTHTRLVSLSACETGVPDIARGSPDEYVGVPAGFLVAGVPCVISSLWAVPDISTALLLERFYYNHVSQAHDPCEALAEAQLWVRDLEVTEVLAYAKRRLNEPSAEENPYLWSYLHHYGELADRDAHARPFAHPYYWAAFSVNGL